jgi:hypothetical protein
MRPSIDSVLPMLAAGSPLDLPISNGWSFCRLRSTRILHADSPGPAGNNPPSRCENAAGPSGVWPRIFSDSADKEIMRHVIRSQPCRSRDLFQRLRAYVAARSLTISAVANAALADYLDWDEVEAPLIVRRLDEVRHAAGHLARDLETLAVGFGTLAGPYGSGQVALPPSGPTRTGMSVPMDSAVPVLAARASRPSNLDPVFSFRPRSTRSHVRKVSDRLATPRGLVARTLQDRPK